MFSSSRRCDANEFRWAGEAAALLTGVRREGRRASILPLRVGEASFAPFVPASIIKMQDPTLRKPPPCRTTSWQKGVPRALLPARSFSLIDN